MRDLLLGLTAGNTGIPPKKPILYRDPLGFSTQQIHAHSMPCSPKHWPQGLKRTECDQCSTTVGSKVTSSIYFQHTTCNN